MLNSLVVRVPFNLIFWQFWWFTVFKLVVILVLVVQGSKAFLPMPPSWLELSSNFITTVLNILKDLKEMMKEELKEIKKNNV